MVAVDLRGYGKSDKPDDVHSYKMDRLVEDVLGIITALGKRDECLTFQEDALFFFLISFFAQTHGSLLFLTISLNWAALSIFLSVSPVVT